MDRIKLRITVVIALAVFLLKGTDTFAQQTDPTLTGAVFAQTSTLKNIYDKRQKAHEKIIAAETAVTVALDRVHSVEEKMLEYLSNAQPCRISIRLSVPGNWWPRRYLRTAACCSNRSAVT